MPPLFPSRPPSDRRGGRERRRRIPPGRGRCAGRAVRRKFLDRLAEGGGAAFGIGGYAFRRVWIGKARKADFPADAQGLVQWQVGRKLEQPDRKSTRLNSSH